MKTFWIILLLLLPLSMIAAEDEGDEKILETIKKIQEEAEEEEEDSDWDDEEDGDDGFCGCLLDACFEIGGELFLEYAIHLLFAPYPYAPSVGYIFSTLDYHDFSNRKVVSLNLASDLSTHFDGTYGNTNRLTAQLTGFQLNVFNQTIFASSVSLETVSINAGLSLLIGSFDLSGFAGAYIVATTGTGYVSAGISSRIFFPARLYLDLYGLYAFVSENTGILHLVGSLNFAIWRFSIGAGYNYNNFLGDAYAGPCLKISFWL
jgi:hypothetical protein